MPAANVCLEKIRMAPLRQDGKGVIIRSTPKNYPWKVTIGDFLGLEKRYGCMH